MKTTKSKKMIALCCVAIYLLSHYPTVTLMAKTTPDSQRIAEVKSFVKELYMAISNRDVNRIRDGLDDDATEDWATRLVTLYSDDVGFGFQRYKDVEVKAYAILDGYYFVAYVAYDLIIEWKGEELALPGISSYLIRQSENSQWRITSGNDLPGELLETLEEEILQVYGSDEIYYWFNDISAEYNDIIVNTLGLSDWISKVNDEAVHWIGSRMASEAFRERGAWDYFLGEENGILTASLNGEDDNEDNIYIVQKGDCLWSIAEQELGDGMYWVRLYEANRDVIGENPDLLWVGTELVLKVLIQ